MRPRARHPRRRAVEASSLLEPSYSEQQLDKAFRMLLQRIKVKAVAKATGIAVRHVVSIKRYLYLTKRKLIKRTNKR